MSGNKLLPIFFITAITLVSCTTSGTYVNFTPAAKAVFDYENFSEIAIIFMPSSGEEKRFTDSLQFYLQHEQFRITESSRTAEYLNKNKTNIISSATAKKAGRFLGANAVLIIKQISFTSSGRVKLAVIEIHDSWGGLLVDALYIGEDNPASPEIAAKLIVHRIAFQDSDLKNRRGHRKNRLLLFPEHK